MGDCGERSDVRSVVVPAPGQNAMLALRVDDRANGDAVNHEGVRGVRLKEARDRGAPCLVEHDLEFAVALDGLAVADSET